MGESNWNFAFSGELTCCIGLAPLFEALANERHHHNAEKVVVPTADVVNLLAKVVLLNVLAYVAHLDTEEYDAPRYVGPKHEHRDDGKRTVDGVVA